MGNSGKKAANNAAWAAEQAALAQQRQAMKFNEDITYVADKFARSSVEETMRYTPQQLRALDQQYASTSRQLENEERLMSSIDPALMEASNQALKLLRGEASPTSGALSGQRNEQRQQLVNRLREQFGAGAESSSIGMKALRQFDSESQNLQQGLLGSLLQTSLAARPDLGRTQAGLSSIAQNYGALGQQGAQAYGQAGQMKLNAIQAGGQALMNTAGAEWTYEVQGQQARANAAAAKSAQIGNLIGTGAGLAGAAFFGPAGGMMGSGLGSMFGGGGGWAQSGGTAAGQSYRNYGNVT